MAWHCLSNNSTAPNTRVNNMGDDEENPYTVEYLDEPDAGPVEPAWIKRAGKAKVVYSNGNTYEGQFSEDKLKEGEGTYTWSTNAEDEEDEEGPPKTTAQYSGQYRNGKRHGKGKMTFPNGDTYTGEWENNKMNGEGTYIYKTDKGDADVFSGTWVADVKQGEGTYEFGVDKSQLVGTWEAGSIVAGTWRFPDGGCYEGKFENGKPAGEGSFKHANGYTQPGTFVAKAVDDDEEATTVEWQGGTVA